MSFEITNTDGLRRDIKAVIARETIDSRVGEKLKELGAKVRLPGFRPGKVPTTILRQRFGQQVTGEVVEELVRERTSEILTETEIRPVAEPKVEITSFDDGQPLEFSLEVEALPEIQAPDFAAITLAKKTAPVSDAQLEEAIERLAKAHSQKRPPAEERPAQTGDVITMDFNGTVDGEPRDGMAAEDFDLELGSNRLIPGFEDQLIGVSKGESKDVVVTFPADYGEASLAGQEAVFAVTVKDIQEQAPAEINDDFARENMNLEGVDALRSRMRESLEQEHRSYTRMVMKRDLLDDLSERVSFDLPATMVDQEFHSIWHQIEHAIEHDHLDEEDKGKSEDELKTEYRGIAERRVKLGLLLAEVGRAQSIEVTEEELRQAMMQQARQYPGQERQVFEFYQKNPQAIGQLRAPIFEDKVIDYILELVQTTEETVDREALIAASKEVA